MSTVGAISESRLNLGTGGEPMTSKFKSTLTIITILISLILSLFIVGNTTAQTPRTITLNDKSLNGKTLKPTVGIKFEQIMPFATASVTGVVPMTFLCEWKRVSGGTETWIDVADTSSYTNPLGFTFAFTGDKLVLGGTPSEAVSVDFRYSVRYTSSQPTDVTDSMAFTIQSIVRTITFDDIFFEGKTIVITPEKYFAIDLPTTTHSTNDSYNPERNYKMEYKDLGKGETAYTEISKGSSANPLNLTYYHRNTKLFEGRSPYTREYVEFRFTVSDKNEARIKDELTFKILSTTKPRFERSSYDIVTRYSLGNNWNGNYNDDDKYRLPSPTSIDGSVKYHIVTTPATLPSEISITEDKRFIAFKNFDSGTHPNDQIQIQITYGVYDSAFSSTSDIASNIVTLDGTTFEGVSLADLPVYDQTRITFTLKRKNMPKFNSADNGKEWTGTVGKELRIYLPQADDGDRNPGPGTIDYYLIKNTSNTDMTRAAVQSRVENEYYDRVPFEWVTIEALPGLTYTRTTLSIRGTPTQAGTYRFAWATSGYTRTIDDHIDFTITIKETTNPTPPTNPIVNNPVNPPEPDPQPPTNSPPTFSATSIDDITGTIGQALSPITLPIATDTDGDTIVYSVSTLPQGLVFDPSTRTISGTPQTQTARTAYTYTATAASQSISIQFYITIKEAPTGNNGQTENEDTTTEERDTNGNQEIVQPIDPPDDPIDPPTDDPVDPIDPPDDPDDIPINQPSENNQQDQQQDGSGTPVIQTDNKHDIVFSEIMFETEGKPGSLPQWYELYNTTDRDIDIEGWALLFHRNAPYLHALIYISDTFIITSKQARILGSIVGVNRSRHELLQSENVYDLYGNHHTELKQEGNNENNIISRGGFTWISVTRTVLPLMLLEQCMILAQYNHGNYPTALLTKKIEVHLYANLLTQKHPDQAQNAKAGYVLMILRIFLKKGIMVNRQITAHPHIRVSRHLYLYHCHLSVPLLNQGKLF